MTFTKHILVIVSLALSVVVYGQTTAGIDKSVPKLRVEDNRPITFTCDSLLSYAHSFLKTPYRLGSSTGKAFDCSGFSSFIFRHFGYNLHRTSSGQAETNGITVARTELKPGDLVFFKGRNAKKQRVGHVGIVVEADELGNFTFIHASVKYGVTITESKKDYYNTRYVIAKRIIEETNTPPEILPIEVRIQPLIIN